MTDKIEHFLDEYEDDQNPFWLACAAHQCIVHKQPLPEVVRQWLEWNLQKLVLEDPGQSRLDSMGIKGKHIAIAQNKIRRSTALREMYALNSLTNLTADVSAGLVAHLWNKKVKKAPARFQNLKTKTIIGWWENRGDRWKREPKIELTREEAEIRLSEYRQFLPKFIINEKLFPNHKNES